jgi:hypothetical protein
MMKIVQRLWSVVDLPCGKCGGRRVIINPAVIAFTQKHGVALWQVGNAVLANEETMYGPLGTMPVEVWTCVGFNNEAWGDFFDIAHCHEVIACPVCAKGEDHGDTREEVKAAIRRIIREELGNASFTGDPNTIEPDQKF